MRHTELKEGCSRTSKQHCRNQIQNKYDLLLYLRSITYKFSLLTIILLNVLTDSIELHHLATTCAIRYYFKSLARSQAPVILTPLLLKSVYYCDFLFSS